MSEHELWNELGNLYFMSGTYKQAAYAYNRSIQLEAGFGRPYCNLALTYVKEGRYEEAVHLYQRSIELLADQTEKAITWYRLGDVYRHLKNYRDAIMAYQQADILNPGLSQESKESDEILYGGSGEGLPAGSPEMQARVLETEAAVEAAIETVAVEEPVEAEMETSPVTETALIQASSIMASVTSTAPVEETAVTETETILPEPGFEQPETETLAVLEMVEPQPEPADEPVEVPAMEELEALPVEEIIEAPVIAEAEETFDASTLETEPATEVSAITASMEPDPDPEPEPELHDFGVTQPVETLNEVSAVEETGEPQVKIEIVFDREEPASVEVTGMETPVEVTEPEMEERAETVFMPEMPEDVTETLSMPEEPAPAVQTLSNATDPEATWIDDDYLISNFDHETEVILPDFEDDPVWIPLPLEPEPLRLPAQPENSWNSEERMQVAVQPPLTSTRRLPGQMLRESWEPALPLAEADLELTIPEEAMEDVFIDPQETPALEPVSQAEPPGCPGCEPDALQTAEELEQIEKEITRFKYVVQSNPRNAAAWDTLGTFYKSARKYREAILAYQQAVAVEPSRASYHHHLGIMYSIQGREEDAMKAFQDVIEIDPEHGLANATLGGYYRKMGLEELAQKHIGRAMKNFYNSENEYNKACLEALCGNVEQSIELLKIALKNKQTYVDWVLRDPDLDSIRRDPRFKQLIADYLG